MGYLRMVEAKLPPGFRFHPRDDELICDYLAPYKLLSDDISNIDESNIVRNRSFPVLIDIDLNKCEPWDLPDMACVGSKEWYFFNLRDRKYATGQRTNRATISGYWKATGKDRQIQRKGMLVGMRKTLVFYQGRAPKGKKTDWVMHEFRSEAHRVDNHEPRLVSCKEDWVLCRVFYKSRGIGTSSKAVTKDQSCMEEDTCCSSSLPSLTDHNNSYNNGGNYFPPLMNVNVGSTSTEQVPCFSSFIPQFNSNPLMLDMNRNNSCFNSSIWYSSFQS